MTTLREPDLRYGRKKKDDGTDEYAVLGQSDNVPKRAADFFASVFCKSIEWTGGGNEKYPESFLFWRIPDAGGILFGRLSDGGEDSRDPPRPHTVSIEVWYAEHAGGVQKIWQELLPAEYHSEVLRFLSSSDRSFLIATHPHYSARGIDKMISPSGNTTEPYPKPTTPQPRPVPPVPLPEPKSSIPLWCIFLLLVLAAGLIGTGWWGFDKSVELENKKTELNDLQTKYDTQETELTTRTRERDKANAEAKTNADKIAKLEEEKQKIQTQLDAALKNASASLTEANKRLTEENKQYDDFLKAVKKLTDDLPAKLEKKPDKGNWGLPFGNPK